MTNNKYKRKQNRKANIIRLFSDKCIRGKLLYMLLILVIVRLGSQIPVYGVNAAYIKEFMSAPGLNMLDILTGGSLSGMSIFALSVTPYITASIIIQLLTIAIPALESMQEDGETGHKKLEKITQYLAMALAVMESSAMCIGFSRQGIFTGGVFAMLTAIVTMSAGAMFLMWLGSQCTANGIGNGVSFILAVNILSRVPQMLASVYEQFIKGKTPAWSALTVLTVLIILVGTTAFVVVLDGAVRKIPVNHSKKVTTSSIYLPQTGTDLSLKVNTSGVIAVIFASSVMSFPGIIATFAGKTENWGWLAYLNQGNWFSLARPAYSLGVILYGILVFFFAYFYTYIQFNPALIADNLRKQGATIPGTPAGQKTEAYIRTVLNRIIPIGAAGLLLICMFPNIVNGVSAAHISFGGTSLIIIAGVIVEIAKQVEAMLADKGGKGFLA